MGAASAYVTSPASSLDIPSLRDALFASRGAIRQLGTVTYWWARSIEEMDEWKRFTFQFTALENLANKLAARAHQAVVARLHVTANGASRRVPAAVIPMPKHAGGKFAFVALLLSPETALADTASFEHCVTARNRLAHGGLRLDEPLPHTEADALLRTYVPLALAYATHQ